MSNQLYSGQGRDINVFAGQSLAVSSITGAYTATIIAGAGIGTALATDSAGGATYGPYSGGVTVRLKAGEGGLIDYEAAVSPVLNYAGPARLGYSAAGDTSSVVDGGGNAFQVTVGLSASGDTSGATDRANMQALHDAFPSNGGHIQLNAGIFYLNAAVVITKPVKLSGAGAGIAGNAGTAVSVGPTTINCLSATANGFTVSASGCTFRDFALVNTYVGTPTAGAGIENTSMTSSTIDAITVVGFWNNLDLGGVYYSVTNCRIYDAVNYYMYHHSPSLNYDDHGDFTIANNVFSGWKKPYNAVTHLRWEGGGGIKITGNKFNGLTQPGNGSAGEANYCMQFLCPDGTATGSLAIAGNSISAALLSHILIGQLGPINNGAFASVSISANEFAVAGQGITIQGNATYDDKIKGVYIGSNIFSFISGSSIKVRYVRSCHIGVNMHNGVQSLLVDIPDLAPNCIGLRVERQHFSATATGVDVVRDGRSTGNTATALQGGIDYDYTQGLGISAVGTWVQVFKIEVQNQAAGKFRVDLDGRSTDTGNNSAQRKGVTIRQERSFDVNGSGAVTVATIGTDVAAGAASTFVAVRYTVTTNFIAVEVQTTDATNCVLWGTVRLRVDGKLQTFHVGT